MARYIDADKLERALRESRILPEITADRDTEFTSAWGVPIVEGNLAHAHWIIIDKPVVDGSVMRTAICSACLGPARCWFIPANAGFSFTGPYFPTIEHLKFCSFCGAKMDGDIEKEELK